MNALGVSSGVFGCVFAGALLGLLLRAALPQHHLGADSKDVVKLGMGLIGTMTALLLGLLVASARSSYDTEKSEVTQMSAKIIFLDRVLANYGQQTTEARELLQRTVASTIDRMWPRERSQTAQLDPTPSGGESVYRTIQQLSPQNDAQRSLHSQALSIAAELGQMRWLLFEQTGSSISVPFLVVVVCWLTLIFVSFGLFAPPNATVVTTLFLCALSVSGAVFLILELDHPFEGLIQISSAPMHNALQHLGQ